MNTHEHLSIEILADYAEGLLGDADATSVAEQLASCADCQAEADLLVSVSTILAADDPGPMPTHYAARIDAALADLAAAEPVTPKRTQTATPGEGATVIDLASRRRFTPAARVTSVAASLVLLIGGVALGMQALDTSGSEDPSDGAVAGPQATPTDGQSRYLAYALSAQERPKGKNAEKLKDGSIVDKRTGTKFLKSGKVVFSDGVVVVPKKDGNTEVRTYDVSTGRAERLATFRAEDTQPSSGPKPAASPAASPAPTPKPTPKPTPDAPEVTPEPVPFDAYVTNSGDTYSADNFAVKVQGLLRDAGEVQPAFSESSTDTKPSPTGQNRASARAVRSDDSSVVARGPAPAEVAAKVRRCANQLGLTDVLAGDVGTWKDQSATIVVTRYAANSKQAVGYVVYGDCTKEAPATDASIQWEQRVDMPQKAEEEPTPAPTSTPAPSETLPSVATNTPAISTEQ